MDTDFEIRPADASNFGEIQTIALRMRETLVEVLGKERGESMYSLDWLVDRVQFHLEGREGPAKVFVAVEKCGEIIGHCIVRREVEPNGEIGLFSTTYVCPDYRGKGIAKQFLVEGEAWMIRQRLAEAATYTAPWNEGLRRLYEDRGYSCMPINDEFVRLSKSLTP